MVGDDTSGFQCGPRTRSSDAHQQLARNVNSWFHPRTTESETGGGAISLGFTRFLSVTDSHSSISIDSLC